MKTFQTILVLLTLMIGLPVVSSFADEDLDGHAVKPNPNFIDPIKWESGTIKEAMAKARGQKKILFVLFYKENCGYCQKLKTEVLPDADVKSFLDSFVTYKADMNTPEGKDLGKFNRAFSTPVSILFEPTGEEIDRVVGFWGVADYLKRMDEYSRRINTLQDYLNRHKKNPTDPELLYNIGQKLLDRRLDDDAFAYLDKVATADPQNKKGFTDDALFLKGRFLHAKLQKAKEAEAPLLKVLDAYSNSDKAVETFNRLMWVYTALKDPAAMLVAYDKYTKVLPKDPEIQRVAATELCKNWDDPKYNAAGMKAIQKAIQMDGKDAKNYSVLATIYAGHRDFDDALSALDKAMKLDPENKVYKNRYEQVVAERSKPH